MSSRVVLILGAGANIGKSLITKFSSEGFKIAIASRTSKPEFEKAAAVSVTADLSDPSSIKAIFTRVKSEIGIPNVVIYNGMQPYSLNLRNMRNGIPLTTHSAGASTFVPTNPLSVPLSAFEHDLAVNVTSVYAAAQEAVFGFDSLPKETLKSFIYTGNGLNVVTPMPVLLTLGVGKSAAAHLIQASSIAYKDAGYR